MTTPRLLMTEWTENQNQPHVPVNSALRALEVFSAFVSVLDIKDEPEDSGDMEEGDIFLVSSLGTGDWEFHDNEIAYYSNGVKFITPQYGMIAYVLSTNELLQYEPDNSEGAGWYPVPWAIQPDSSGNLDIGPQPYVAGATFNGSPTSDQVLMRHPIPLTVVFPEDLLGSQGFAEIAADAQTDFDIQKNGVSIGTMRFAAAATVATFIMASEETFAAGDVLTVIAPSSPDADLADIGFSLLGER